MAEEKRTSFNAAWENYQFFRSNIFMIFPPLRLHLWFVFFNWTIIYLDQITIQAHRWHYAIRLGKIVIWFDVKSFLAIYQMDFCQFYFIFFSF